MVRVRIDIPVFHSPTQALGHATGVLELGALPAPLTTFPWPKAWVDAKPEYFTEHQSLISSVTPWEFPEAEYRVGMYGIICESADDARECASFLEQAGGLEFNEY